MEPESIEWMLFRLPRRHGPLGWGLRTAADDTRGGDSVVVSALDFRQTGMAAMCDDAAAAGVPLELIRAGDRLIADEDVTLEVLHPAPGYGDELDNANSVVLRVAYAGRTILLTGDLEERGLDELLAALRNRSM